MKHTIIIENFPFEFYFKDTTQSGLNNKGEIAVTRKGDCKYFTKDSFHIRGILKETAINYLNSLGKIQMNGFNCQYECIVENEILVVFNFGYQEAIRNV